MTGLTLNGDGTGDAGEREYTHTAIEVTGSGNTTIYTPASGKRIRLWRAYALNDPSTDTPRLITIKIGSKVHSITYGVMMRQKFTGGVNDTLVVNLSGTGQVAFTAILEEI